MNKSELIKTLLQHYENDEVYSKDKRPLKTFLTQDWQEKITEENLMILIRKIENAKEAEEIYKTSLSLMSN